jgi:alpha-tubulin suppressor-like RCC1 family protein
VRCWGWNGDGELGNGSLTEQFDTAVVTKNPTGTGPLQNVVQLALGDYHTCALLTTGQVRCWGDGDSGEIGNGDFGDRLYPTVVRNATDTAPLQNVIAISAESDGACAVLSNHQVRCWGEDDYGQLGNGLPHTNSALPVRVRGVGGTGSLSNIASLGGGYDTNCAVTQGGQGRCWGYDSYGGLGDSTDIDGSEFPTRVENPNGTPLTGVTQISNGGYHGCARLTNGQARCWGYNYYGQLGVGGTDDRTGGRVVRTPGGTPLANVVSIEASYDSTCALLTSGQVRCWGSDEYGQNGDGTFGSPDHREYASPVRNAAGTGNLTGVRVLAGKSYHYCVGQGDGRARCWGYGDYGHIGDGSDVDRARPVLVVL